MNAVQRWLRRWSREMERYLFRFTIAVFALLLAGQLLLLDEKAQRYLNRVYILEGAAYNWIEEALFPERSAGENEQGAFKGIYWIELALLEGHGPLEVLRNGVAAGVLQSGSIIVYVSPGDRIEIRGEPNRSGPALVEVRSTNGLAYPRAGEKIHTYGDDDLIGWAVPGKEN